MVSDSVHGRPSNRSRHSTHGISLQFPIEPTHAPLQFPFSVISGWKTQLTFGAGHEKTWTANLESAAGEMGIALMLKSPFCETR